MGYSAWYSTDDQGRVERVRVAAGEQPAPWRRAPASLVNAIRQTPRKYRDVDGELIELPEVRLSISIPTFRADGEDHADVTVYTDAPDPGPIALRVNGHAEQLSVGEVLELASETEGTFVVEMVDPRFYAPESIRRVTALEITE